MLLAHLLVTLASAQPLARSPNTTLRMPERPPVFGYTTTDALSGLSFVHPVAMASPPGETNRLFVAEMAGVIYAITNLANPTRTVFLDLSGVVFGGVPQRQQGFSSIAFHPGFVTNRYFYVAYVMLQDGPEGSRYHDRVSRFQVSLANPNQALPGSELVLIDQHDEGESHNINDLKFGPDGYLYISIGDEGDPADYLNNSQRINKDFFSGVLRIDVDKRSGNLLPNPNPASTTNYCVPADNPFVGATSFNGLPVNPNQVRTEFYAVGLRNPWRMAFDTETGLLYCGDVGESAYEEINIIAKGGNYGWSFLEATQPGPKAAHEPDGFSSVLPILEYAHGTGFYEGHSLIGGFVYRGNRLAQLQGAYIFADYVSGNIWQLRYDGAAATAFQRLTFDKDISSFGVDPRNGDILMADLSEGKIKRLDYNDTPSGPAIPGTLAEAGVFSNLQTLAPHPGIVPYDLNVPFWSDNAIKSRWFSVPNINLRIGFNAQGNWSFPTGTVWIKHFDLQLTNGIASSSRRLETRLLVKNPDGVYGVTYRWGDSASNATLVPDEGLDEPFLIHDGGTVRTQIWHYPSRSECLSCHTPVAGYALGFNTHQLNRNFHYGGMVTNQLEAFSYADYFLNPVNGVETMPALAHATNQGANLEHRARSYLAANCVQCHQPGGSGGGYWDARITTPLSDAGIINGLVRDNAADPLNRVIKPGSLPHSMLLTRISSSPPRRMPPLATALFDTQSINLITQWITNMPYQNLPPPPAPPTGLRATAGNAQVDLTWAGSSGATAYVVRRSTSSGAGYATIVTNQTTSFTDVGLTNDLTYYYVVSAVSPEGQSSYSAEASAQPNNRPVPVVKVAFDEFVGATSPNLGSAGGSFTLTDSIPLRSANVPINIGGIRSIDMYISPGNYGVDSDTVINALRGISQFTITGWVNNRSSQQGAGGNRIVTWIDNDGHGVDLAYKSDGSLTLGVNQRPDGRARSSEAVISEDLDASPDNWRFFAVTYDAAEARVIFYFGSNTTDATLDVARIYSGQGPVGTNIGRLTLGNLNPTTRFGATDRMFRGLIDEVQIYTNVLSLAEIVAVQRTLPESPPALPTVNISATQPDVSEAGPDDGILTVSRSGQTAADLIVYFVAGGTATSGQDYVVLTNSVMIPAHSLSATIAVAPLNDNFSEGLETVSVTLVAQPNYMVGLLNSASVTIADDEPPPPVITITATDAAASEPGSNLAIFTVSRTVSNSDLTVSYTVGGTAVEGVDYASLSGTVTFLAGTSSTDIQVRALDDLDCEMTETVIMTLASGTDYVLGSPSTATVTLADDECLPPLVSIFPTDGVADEAGTDAGALKVFRVGTLSSDLTVHFTLGGTAQDGLDYVSIGSFVTIPAGSAFSHIPILPLDDTASEGTETAMVTLVSSAEYSLSPFSNATVQIGDNDYLRPLVRLTFEDEAPESTTNSGTLGGLLALTAPLPTRSDLVPPLPGNGYSLDMGTANGNYGVDSPNVISELGGLTQFTITGWINNRSSVQPSGGNRIVTWQSGLGGNGVEVVYRQDGSLDIGIDQPSSGEARSSAEKIPTDISGGPENWRFFAVTYDATNEQVAYYFGSSASAAAFDKIEAYPGIGAVGTEIDRLTIGNLTPASRSTIGNRQFRGLIDDVRIYGDLLQLSHLIQVQHGGELGVPDDGAAPEIRRIELLPDGQIYLQAVGQSGQTYRILAGDTPTGGSPVSTNTVGSTGIFEFFETHHGTGPPRFYRIVTP